eukprot:GCRY01002304.1.p1 GENE.GCRY01002304.1~~GCRY01002304.1.p1  ORF type:complete len:380 (+),score=98.88 GCRY01002304.1:206-1345(+)
MGIFGSVSLGVSKALYSFVFFSTVATTLLLRWWNPGFLGDIGSFDSCEHENSCISKGLVFRMTFGLFIFFIFHSFVCLCLSRSSVEAKSSFHNGGWFFKILIWIVLLVVSFFISNSFYDSYSTFALIGAAIFILLQILILVEFAYAWNEKWVNKAETKNNNAWLGAIVAAAAAAFIAGLVILSLAFHFFTQNDGCGLNTFFISLTIVLAIAYTVMSLMESFPNGSLLSAAVVFFYCCQLTWSAMMSQPNTDDRDCNTLSSNDNGKTWQLLLSLGVAVVAVTYRAQKAAGSKGQAVLHTEDISSQDEYNFQLFHVIFALAALYIAMILTQWGTSGSDTDPLRIDHGEPSMWINLSTSWVAAALYIWSLVAPLILKNRDFS